MSTWTLFFLLLQFRWFQIEVLQAMEKNVKLDEEYIEVSSQRGKAPFWRLGWLKEKFGNLLGYLSLQYGRSGLYGEKNYLTVYLTHN